MTPAAGEALAAAEVIVGYQTYLDLIPEFLAGKEVIASQMMKEVDRCRKALDLAAEGKKVALVSGGDPGIYAMAGLVFEMAREQNASVDIEVIAGIAALNACAARLGAPLMHDFAAISLSDLLTPWEKIERRLEAAAAADFVVVIYNPKSKKRAEHIVKAREILLAHRDPETPVGIVTAATRENERIVLTTLAKMLESEIDMQTTIIVGNSMTFAWQGFMVTPRGYAAKYAL
ncbi:precorrin-3B C(17)-methyltransferase [Thiovibrio frasassiensis]|uniref:Precorrin-3B C(17)-methyltransferase n=1 Tax=Thiovibrio frasassiensis TaxID=2984131 RepID=A0A9X4MFU4_9BACT|nr:precorrin-3B C(17)-methyltransferase [Thiovibrio frasassiensis]MDG4476714.1 precorrin-3B C(17)-methyltransferase [Thiovibrio frasassiensis]